MPLQQRQLVDELIRRASEGCEGPLDDPCWKRPKLPMHLWCDPCRCQEAAKALRQVAGEPSPSGWQPVAVVDGRCGCDRCRARTENIYRMIGVCYNCGAKPILMLFRAGDPTAAQDCPKCGNYHTVHSTRPATDDEVPLPSAPAASASRPSDQEQP